MSIPAANKRVMTANISAWKILSLNEYFVQIRLGSNLGGFFYFRKKEDAYGRKSGSKLRDFYEFIIIDCMPSPGMMTINACSVSHPLG